MYTQTAIMQHCICTRQRAQGEWAAAAAIGEAGVIKPYGGMDGGLWFGECECVDSHSERERERENQSDRQGHSFHASFTPNNNTPNEAADACVKV